MVQFDPELTEMIFFDLEFYVPKVDRNKLGASLLANPLKQDHFLLGGVFYRDFPLKKGGRNPHFEHYWIWKMDNEKAVLAAIYSFFKNSWNLLRNKDPQQADLITTGIGISRFDIPILYIRSLNQIIATPAELFECYFKTKQVDFTNVGITFFNKGVNILYPKTANQLMRRFGIQKEKTTGMSIWDMYDNNEFQNIENRTESEVRDAIQIYKKMQKQLFR